MIEKLSCCICGEAEILAPPGTVPHTRFFCRWCVEGIVTARHIADVRRIHLPATWPLIGAARPREILSGFLALCGR